MGKSSVLQAVTTVHPWYRVGVAGQQIPAQKTFQMEIEA